MITNPADNDVLLSVGIKRFILPLYKLNISYYEKNGLYNPTYR